jgi:hypothetical protein
MKKEKIDFNDESNFKSIMNEAKSAGGADVIQKVTGLVMNHPKKLIFSLVYLVICGLIINIKWVYLLILKLV